MLDSRRTGTGLAGSSPFRRRQETRETEVQIHYGVHEQIHYRKPVSEIGINILRVPAVKRHRQMMVEMQKG